MSDVAPAIQHQIEHQALAAICIEEASAHSTDIKLRCNHNSKPGDLGKAKQVANHKQEHSKAGSQQNPSATSNPYAPAKSRKIGNDDSSSHAVRKHIGRQVSKQIASIYSGLQTCTLQHSTASKINAQQAKAREHSTPIYSEHKGSNIAQSASDSEHLATPAKGCTQQQQQHQLETYHVQTRRLWKSFMHGRNSDKQALGNGNA